MRERTLMIKGFVIVVESRNGRKPQRPVFAQGQPALVHNTLVIRAPTHFQLKVKRVDRFPMPAVCVGG
jgi:hypothetical protein